MELGEALRIGPNIGKNTYASSQAPLGPRIFYENPLSSVAYGATPFLRKGAKNCGASRHHPLNPLNPLNLLNLKYYSPIHRGAAFEFVVL